MKVKKKYKFKVASAVGYKERKNGHIVNRKSKFYFGLYNFLDVVSVKSLTSKCDYVCVSCVYRLKEKGNVPFAHAFG